jgi:hypothetical protein
VARAAWICVQPRVHAWMGAPDRQVRRLCPVPEAACPRRSAFHAGLQQKPAVVGPCKQKRPENIAQNEYSNGKNQFLSQIPLLPRPRMMYSIQRKNEMDPAAVNVSQRSRDSTEGSVVVIPGRIDVLHRRINVATRPLPSINRRSGL